MSLDRLYNLLPVIYRQQDAKQGYPLKALLHVIAEQVNVVEDDIDQLYSDWFVETAQSWVLPYLGALVGYRLVSDVGELETERDLQRLRRLVTRRDVARTITYRRRKGTLALLELLANDVAGWPARAVEFYRLLAWTQHVNHLRPRRGGTADLRRGDALAHVDGPFDRVAHTVDVRHIDSTFPPGGRYNIPSIGLFVWRLHPYSVTRTVAQQMEGYRPNCFHFSVLGNDAPLFTLPIREEHPTDIASELNVPVPISRRALAVHRKAYYGPRKSLMLWHVLRDGSLQPIPPKRILAADLTDWDYIVWIEPEMAEKDYPVLVDPELGRIVFHPRDKRSRSGVWVSYHYGFSADMGGGEYARPLSQEAGSAMYRVGEHEQYTDLGDALRQWLADLEEDDAPQHAVIEITTSGLYERSLPQIRLPANRTLQIRAASGVRPVIRLVDRHRGRLDGLQVWGEPGSRLTLDGLLLAEGGIYCEGQLAELAIRHCTLVPGWTLDPSCEPRSPTEPSIELFNTQTRLVITSSIVGSIQVHQDEVNTDPCLVRIVDSILDSTGLAREALGGTEDDSAHAVLVAVRSTVIGLIRTHAIELAEDSIFMSRVWVERRQIGCLRFCYVEPESQTPRRFHCQPDLVDEELREGEVSVEARAHGDDGAAREHEVGGGARTHEVDDAERARMRLRVRPRFNSLRYGTPDYAQLALSCDPAITRGAEDRSEMGAFHDLYQPQRAATLRARLDEYTAAGMESRIIFAT
ncbi:MAG: hypothetical protein GYB65_17310 [Chloroflexi bacterium]|nr:hypothetical protein [Chloroflexota bacterium]